jgi:acetyl-CoA acetyltransferase
MKGKAAIAGLGLTEMGRVYGRSATDFAVEAIRLALDDAGLERDELDGVLINSGITQGLDLGLPAALGCTRLRLLSQVNAFGASAGAMIQYAALAVNAGLADHVACVFADAPLREGERTGAAYGGGRRYTPKGMGSLYPVYGYGGPIPYYAMMAQRHMDLYGTTQQQLGAVAVSTREWATKNPLAQMRQPLTQKAYAESPWIVEPFHVLDCCLVSNGGACVIVTRADRARDLRQPPAYLWGMGQAHQFEGEGIDAVVESPGASSSRTAFAMAGIEPSDVTACELYDCYTFTVVKTLEDYGLCPLGEGGRFVGEGATAPGGVLPTNTGGGELSSYYMWGMTPISEAVIQARGHGGERQVERNDAIAVSGNGGMFSFHSTLVMSPHAS